MIFTKSNRQTCLKRREAVHVSNFSKFCFDGLAYQPCAWCDFAAQQTQLHMKVLHEANLWDLLKSNEAIGRAIWRAETMTIKLLPSQVGNHHCHHQEPQTKCSRNAKLEDLKAASGLCLGCVRLGKADGGYPYNIEH